MKRLAMAATLVVALYIPTFAGEVPTVGVVTPQPTPMPTQTTSTNTNTSMATTILLTLISLGLISR
jgi:uncharacterized membrane protein